MLSFDPIPHRYTWNGRPVPSVTQCLEPLFDWSSVPPEVLENKRRIGVEVHHAIENDLLGKRRAIHASAQPYFDAWRRFRDECRFEPILIEYRVTSGELGERLRYAGTLDEWGLLQEYPALIDWKTSLVLNTPAVGAQTAAYLKALVNMKSVGAALSDRRFALKLGKDGRYKLERFRAIADDWQRFVLQLRAHSMMAPAC
jgi:hypothetical protein